MRMNSFWRGLCKIEYSLLYFSIEFFFRRIEICECAKMYKNIKYSVILHSILKLVHVCSIKQKVEDWFIIKTFLLQNDDYRNEHISLRWFPDSVQKRLDCDLMYRAASITVDIFISFYSTIASGMFSYLLLFSPRLSFERASRPYLMCIKRVS